MPNLHVYSLRKRIKNKIRQKPVNINKKEPVITFPPENPLVEQIQTKQIYDEFKSIISNLTKQNVNNDIDSLDEYVEYSEYKYDGIDVYKNLDNFYDELDTNIDENMELPYCSICYEDLWKDIVELDCGHSFHKECLSKWGEYDKADFVSEVKHKCPECRIGKIKLNPDNKFHQKIMNSGTKWLKDEYQFEGKNLPKEEIILHRFCYTCEEIFEVLED